MKFDKVAWQIIDSIRKDARKTNKQVGKEIGVSETTVRNRIKELTKEKEIQLSALIDPEKHLDKHLVTLGVKLAATKALEAKAKQIAKLDNVLSVSITSGRFDLLVEIWVDTKTGLINFLGETLSKVDGVIGTESFLAMKTFNKWI